MLVATYSEELLYGTGDLRIVVLHLALVVIGSAAVMVAPLLVFAPQLFEVRQQGLLDYGALAERYVRAFDRKWLRADAPPDEPLLGSADVQSLADLSNAFGVIQNMRLIPMSLTQFLVLVGGAALPALPLVLFVVPLDELIVGGAKAFLNL